MLEQSGLLQIYSRPSGANVRIDNENQFGKTDFSKMLSSGKHHIHISKDGYGDWEKDARISAGLLTRIDWVRLFPTNPEISDALSLKDLRLAAFSANHKYLLAIENQNDSMIYANITDDNIQPKHISLSKSLSTKTAEEAQKGTLTIVAWNNEGSKVLIKWLNGDTLSCHLVDLEHSENSVNLSQKFNMSFDSILIASDSADKLWAVENGNLRLIDARNYTISSAIASNITKFAHNHGIVAFVNSAKNGEETEYSLNIFRDGEEGYSTVKKLDTVTPETTIHLAIGTYWNEDWLAFSIDQDLTILSGRYPNYKKDSSKPLEQRLDRNLGYTPHSISVNSSQRVVVLAGDKSLVSFDIETKDYYDTNVDENVTISGINWLEDNILWHNTNNAIVIRDFDGDNRRTIVPNNSTSLPATISENGKWLYYFEPSTKSEASATDGPSDATSSENTETTTNYILKREKL